MDSVRTAPVHVHKEQHVVLIFVKLEFLQETSSDRHPKIAFVLLSNLSIIGFLLFLSYS